MASPSTPDAAGWPGSGGHGVDDVRNVVAEPLLAGPRSEKTNVAEPEAAEDLSDVIQRRAGDQPRRQRVAGHKD
jgi:hypothetical protein